MRAIVNISLSQRLNSVVEDEVAGGAYSSKSEFIRSLIRSFLEEKLAAELEEGRREVKEGRGKVLKSLSSLR